jgi:hypothetical protein
MKLSTVMLALVVLLALASCGDDFDAEAEKKALESAVEEQREAYANVDREAMDRLLHEDWYAQITWEDGQDTIMRQPFLLNFPKQIIELDQFEWITIIPDVAVSKAYCIWVEGETRDRNYCTDVYVKEDGQWQALYGHMSSVPD